jgi:hypothetical protein
MNPGFDAFNTMVRQLWPTYKTDVQPMWDTKLRRYSSDEIGTALWRHRADFPDDAKPSWRTIYSRLSGTTTPGKSDLRILVDGIRKAIATEERWAKHPTAKNWPDSEVFENHIEANLRPILYEMNGKVSDDPDGRLARLAAKTRAMIVNGLIVDLEERGEIVPAWLVR